MRILVVDDNRSYRWIHKRILTPLKATICFAENEKAALEKISNKDYEAIIIQHQGCRGKVGPELYEGLKKLGYSGAVFVLVNDPNTSRQTYNGITEMIHRRITGKDLSDTIMKYLKSAKQEVKVVAGDN